MVDTAAYVTTNMLWDDGPTQERRSTTHEQLLKERDELCRPEVFYSMPDDSIDGVERAYHVCRKCRRVLNTWDNFCRYCGQRLKADEEIEKWRKK